MSVDDAKKPLPKRSRRVPLWRKRIRQDRIRFTSGAWTGSGNFMHPIKPEWNGQNMMGKVKDGNGVDVVKSLVDGINASRDGTAFVPTNFPDRDHRAGAQTAIHHEGRRLELVGGLRLVPGG